MTTANATFYAPGDLMKRFGISRQRLRFLLETRGIQPVAKLGIMGVYDDDAADAVGKALKEIEAKR